MSGPGVVSSPFFLLSGSARGGGGVFPPFGYACFRVRCFQQGRS